MFRGFRWLALGGIVTTAALVGPSVALACDGSGSAVSIYTECTPSASGKHHHSTKKPSSGGSQSPAPTYYVAPPAPVHISYKTKRAVAHSGKDKRFLNRLVTNPNYVESRRLKIKPELAAAPTGASGLSSTFDLGSGPMILLALLAGSVLSVLGTGGVRAWRGRHRA